jgi:hypothetical protein
MSGGLEYLAAVALLGAALTTGVAAEGRPSRLAFAGDFRLRYEGNSAVEEGPERHRGVLRLRVGATYRLNDLLEVGARVATGDPGDPRSTDVTSGDFVDDPQVSLDLAYLEAKSQRAFATGGKFRNPFATTELVWDADVNPPGAAGWLETAPVAGFTPRLTGMFMIVDEQSLGSDSTMWGAQARMTRPAGDRFGLDLALGYWDYTIASLAHADDPGDTRGNLLTPGRTAFLSDFDLADVVVTLSLPGPGAEWPVRVVADYVRNLDAAVDADQGFQVQVAAGRTGIRRAVELLYGYAECETDAVLGAFSNDNLPLATNYRSHTARASWGVHEATTLSLTAYYFRTLDPEAGANSGPDDGYRTRVRLDLMVKF